jgi:hypothetical protein
MIASFCYALGLHEERPTGEKLGGALRSVSHCQKAAADTWVVTVQNPDINSTDRVASVMGEEGELKRGRHSLVASFTPGNERESRGDVFLPFFSSFAFVP